MSTKMDENIENSGEESDNDSILDLDLNPDGVIRPFMFEPQHSSSSGEEEISVDKETQEEIQEETSTRSRLGNREWCSLRQLSRDANRKRVYMLPRNGCTR